MIYAQVLNNIDFAWNFHNFDIQCCTPNADILRLKPSIACTIMRNNNLILPLLFHHVETARVVTEINQVINLHGCTINEYLVKIIS